VRRGGAGSKLYDQHGEGIIKYCAGAYSYYYYSYYYYYYYHYYYFLILLTVNTHYYYYLLLGMYYSTKYYDYSVLLARGSLGAQLAACGKASPPAVTGANAASTRSAEY
jgi:hypothetical protein